MILCWKKFAVKIASPIIAAAMVFICSGVSVLAQDIDPTSNPGVQPYAGTPVSGYVLAWSDEFNGTAVDTNKWGFRTGVRLWSTQLPANNGVSNGLYYLHVKKETVGSTDYTAGGIISTKLFRYGYYETSMKVPPGRGWHTSFWMMKQTLTTNDTAQIELDALENDSITLTSYGINNHRWLPTPVLHFGSKSVTTPSLNAGFHVIGCEYTSSTVKYFFDGVLQQTVATTNFTPADVNIWLTSVAANLGGTTNVDDTQLPNYALYDYARFFVLGPTSAVSIVTPAAGVTLADTNLALRVAASVSSSDTNFPPAVVWSKVSGPGTVTFANATNADTTATFSTAGNYVLQCQASAGTSTNVDQVNVAVNAPLALALREGVGGYAHVATFIRGDSVNWNSGARDQFIVGRNNSQPLRPIYSFALSPLATNAVIQSVSLDYWTDATAGSGTLGDVELRKLNSTPIEGLGTSSSDSSNGAGTGATWLSRTGGTNVSDLWTNAGGDFGTNVLSVVTGYDATITGAQKTFGSTTQFVATAQAALNTGQPLNLLMLSPGTEAGTSNAISRISSDDCFNLTARPQLTLTFLGNYAPGISPGNVFVTLTNVPSQLGGVVSNAVGSGWSKLSGSGAVTFGSSTNPATTVTFSTLGNYSLRLAASNALAQVSRDLAVKVVSTPPQLGSLVVTSNRFQFQITGTTGVTYTVQAGTNLTTWTNLFSTNPAALPFTWSDVGKTNFPCRFYRVLVSP